MAAVNEIECIDSPYEENRTILMPPRMVYWLYNERLAVIMWPAIYFSGTLMVLGLIGNGFVVYAYGLKFRKTPANTFILCLAISDMFCCTVSIPFEIFQLRFAFYPYTDAVTCKLLRAVSFGAYSVQGLTLVCISIDRYLKVCKPLKIYSFNKPLNLMIGTLSLSIILASPAAFVYGIKTVYACIPGMYGKSCSIDDSVKDTIFPSLFYGILLSVFSICFFILFILYIKIVRAIHLWKINRFKFKQQSKNTGGSINESSEEEHSHNGSVLKNKTPRRSHRHGIYYIEDDSELSDSGQNAGIRLNKFGSGTFIPRNSYYQTGNQTDHLSCNGIKDLELSKLEGVQNESEDTTYRKRKIKTIQSNFKRQARATKSVFIFTVVSLCFVMSYVPYLTCEILLKTSIIHMQEQTTTVQKIIEILEKTYCINNACNPIIYSIFNPDFRRVCADLFRLRRSKTQTQRM